MGDVDRGYDQPWARPLPLAIGRLGFPEPGKRRAWFAKLYEASLAELAALRVRAEEDAIGRRQTELAIAVVEGRLAWLKARCDE